MMPVSQSTPDSMRITPTLMLLAFLAACGLTACDSYANDPGDYDPEGDDPPPPVHEPPSEGNVATNVVQ